MKEMNRKKSSRRGWLKRHPLIRTAVQIAVLFAVIALVAYIVMGVGTRHGMKRTVPDMLGLRLSDAEYYASRRGLKVVVNDSLFVPAYPGGVVLEQLPRGGVNVKSGRKIYVTINSFHQPQVPLPYVAGRSLRQAKNMLESAGLTIAELVYVDDIATNYVLGEYYNGTEITAQSALRVERGSGVVLRVGVAADDVVAAVPKLIGFTLADARRRIWESGFNVGEISFEGSVGVGDRDKAKVVWQSVPVGGRTEVGSRISLTATLDAARVTAAEKECERRIEELRNNPEPEPAAGEDSAAAAAEGRATEGGMHAAEQEGDADGFFM